MKPLLLLLITLSMFSHYSCASLIVRSERILEKIIPEKRIPEKPISFSPAVVKNLTDDYQKLKYPLFYAVSENGRYSVSWKCNNSSCSEQKAYKKMLEYCDGIGLDGKCKILYKGKNKVYQFPITTDETLDAKIVSPSKNILYGHQKAKGIIFYFPGYSAYQWPPKINNEKLPAYVKTFNKNGYDIAKVNIPFYNRIPVMIPDIALYIAQLYKEYRTRGYKKVVFAGQSRGAWSILKASSYINSPDAYYILAAPAAYGKKGKSTVFKEQNSAFKKLIRPIKTGNFAFFFFSNDLYDSGQKAKILSENFSEKALVMIVDSPNNLSGHGSAWSYLFDITYSQSLMNFIENKTILSTDRKPNLKNWKEITTRDHVVKSGAKKITGEQLKEILNKSTIYYPEEDYNKYGWYLENSPLSKDNLASEIRFSGKYIRGNKYKTTCHIKNDGFKIYRKDQNAWEYYQVFLYSDDIYFKVREDNLSALPFKVQKGSFTVRNN